MISQVLKNKPEDDRLIVIIYEESPGRVEEPDDGAADAGLLGLPRYRQVLLAQRISYRASGEDPDPVIFDLPELDPTPYFLLIRKIAYIPTKCRRISETSK